MNQHGRDHEEILRRVLKAAADSVEPAEDGLERIRGRLTTPHPRPAAWTAAGFGEVVSRALGRLQFARAWLHAELGAASQRLRMMRPDGPRRLAARRGAAYRPDARLHPLTALTIAVFVVAATVLTFTPLPREAISQTAALIRSLDGDGHAGGTGGPGQAGPGAVQSAGGPAAPGALPGQRQRRHPAAAGCGAGPPALASPAATLICPSPGASGTQPVSPAPTTSASPTACPSPAASPTSSPTASSSTASSSPTAGAGPTACPSPTAAA